METIQYKKKFLITGKDTVNCSFLIVFTYFSQLKILGHNKSSSMGLRQRSLAQSLPYQVV